MGLAGKPMDEDLKELMLRYLEIEKQAVCEELEEYRTALVVVLTPNGRYVDAVPFFDEEDKIAAYSAVVDRARANLATVILTVNATRTMKAAQSDDLDGYWWGKLAAESARDCISITASGPGMKSIALDVGYDIVDGRVHFDDLAEYVETEIGMLPGWLGGDSRLVS
jgi:hypothetical protein